MEEWNIKRMPMLHFCLLTSSLKPVRETCDMSVAVAQRRHWVEANLCSNSSSESRQWRTEREKAGRSAGRWHQQWEGDDRGRASERQKERETSKVSMQILFYVSAATHTPVTRPLAQQGFLCSSLSTVPCTSNYHGAAVWSPMGPSEPGPPRIKTIAAGSERKIHAASSHSESVRKNDPWAHIHPGRSWGEERQVRRPSGGGSEAQEVARVRWRGSVLQQVRGPSLLLVWKNPGCSTSLINNSAVCWSAIYFQLCAAAVSCSVEMFIAEGRNQSRQSFLCSHKRPVTL